SITRSKIARHIGFSGHHGAFRARGIWVAGRTGRCHTSGRSIGGLSRVAPPARNSWAGRPPWRVVGPPVGTRNPGVPVTLRWKLRGSRATPHTASYTLRSSPTVNSGGQNAVARDEYSILERARSTPSARICA